MLVLQRLLITKKFLPYAVTPTMMKLRGIVLARQTTLAELWIYKARVLATPTPLKYMRSALPLLLGIMRSNDDYPPSPSSIMCQRTTVLVWDGFPLSCCWRRHAQQPVCGGLQLYVDLPSVGGASDSLLFHIHSIPIQLTLENSQMMPRQCASRKHRFVFNLFKLIRSLRDISGW